MPQIGAPKNPSYRGWFYDQVNNTLEAYHGTTRVLAATASAFTIDKALTSSAALTVTTGGVTATAGNVQATAGDLVAPAGNASLGNPGAFGTTQPTGAVVMGGSSLGGTAPAGAITTAGAVFASDTVVRKIIADGTASNVET